MIKKFFLVLGNPVSHSLSPTLHNYWFKKYNINAEYSASKLDESEIESTLLKIKKKEIMGANITLPFKKKVIPFLDKLVNDAFITKSVNTIYMDQDNKIVGDNTDVYGVQAGYLKKILDKNLSNIKILVLGAGGVSPSIIYALKKSSIKNIYITNRTQDKSLFLQKQFKDIKVLKWDEFKNNLNEFDIIINATSLGLKNGTDFAEPFQNFKKTLIYIDTIYNPIETKNIKEFKLKNIRTFNGLEMFLYQGQKSFYLWNKINPEINDDIINILIDRLKTQ